MKVCVLSSASFEKNYSSFHLIRDLILHLLDTGYEVSLIQKYYEEKKKLPKEFNGKVGFTVHELEFPQISKGSMIHRIFADIRYFIRTMKYIRAEKNCDVFFLQSTNVSWLPIWIIHHIARKPVVYNVQDVYPQNAVFAGMISEKGIVNRVLMVLQRWSLKRADAVITISEDMKKTLVDAGANADKVTVAYNWENEIHGEGIERVEDGKIHVVYAGNIGVMQNVEIVVEAARRLIGYSEIQFDIYGNGARRKKCEEMAEGLSNIKFFDPVPADQAYSLYCNADVNVVPLAKRIVKTALPSKTAACLQCGKPVIFCVDRDSDWAASIENVGAAVVSPDSAEDLSKHIVTMIYQGNWHGIPLDILLKFDKNNALYSYSKVMANVAM